MFYDYVFIYTDGSKMDDATSFSITTEDSLMFTYLLSDGHSFVFSNQIIIKNDGCKYFICTDSLASVSSISNITHHDYYPYCNTITALKLRSYLDIRVYEEMNLLTNLLEKHGDGLYLLHTI